jgi:hypothetical protein
MNGAIWFYAIVTVAAIVALSWQLTLSLASAKWPRTEGKILASSVETIDGEYPSYVPRVEYEYVVDGRNYRSRKLRCSFWSSSFKSRARRIAAAYRPGDPVAVWYDPEKPSRAVLQTGGSVGLLAAILAVSVIGPGLAFLFRNAH